MTFMTLLMISGTCTLNFIASLFIKPVSVFPTSIPWIHSQSQCNHTNRVWLDNQCWDYEHDMEF